ncbi:MAG: hypothetical protein AAF799_37120 [Myxococcota bacterium]
MLKTPSKLVMLGSLLLASLGGCDQGPGDSLDQDPAFRYFNDDLELNVAFKAIENLEIAVVAGRTFNFECFEGMQIQSEYTLTYPICIPPLPGFCTDTYQLIEECIDGQFEPVSNDLIEHECDYSYSGATCG